MPSTGKPGNSNRLLARLWGCDRAAELAEFALLLPLMVVIFMGIFDFGTAFTLRDKLTNAVREGVRLAARQGSSDLNQAAPPSVQAVRDTVANYLVNTKVTGCALATTPTQVGGANGLTWTYNSSTAGGGCGSVLLTIERSYTGSPPAVINGSTALMSRVTLTYPYSFFGFNRVMPLLGGQNYPGTLQLTVQSVMQNL
jgi:Flp pilus assembly protein TadG